ncbi:hypothetical protein MLD38_021885 [Melastoma candidum]|uniref:Uncharacterized protein n=1 Tax=Melastoma candidum TaxID=119954 RepID=A0ACB9QIP4_9MYRT|nr:hypothetical protein MLD38_021885 [Melastoma candidum]
MDKIWTVNLEYLLDAKNSVVNLAEARGLSLLGVVEAPGPIESNISVAEVKLDCGTNGTAGGSLTEGEEAVENGTVLPDVEGLELAMEEGIGVDEVGGNGGEEGEIVIGVEAAEIVGGGREGAEDLEAAMEVIVDDEAVSHADAVGLHRVALAVEVCLQWMARRSSSPSASVHDDDGSDVPLLSSSAIPLLTLFSC